MAHALALAAVGALLLALPATATPSPGPDGFHYRSETLAWTGIPDGGLALDPAAQLWTSGVADDAYSAAIPIGFPFKFYGDWKTQVHLNSNGFLRFPPPGGLQAEAAAVQRGSPLGLPHAGGPGDLIAAAWTDLDPTPACSTDAAAGIRHRTVGTAPTRAFVAEYRAIGAAGDCARTSTVQVRLLEGSNEVHVHVQALRAADGSVATLGIEDAAGHNGILQLPTPTDTLLETSVRFWPSESCPGPDAFGHRCLHPSWETALAGPWLAPGTAIPLPDNGDSPPLALPFTFPFYGVAHGSVQVNSNGYLRFGGVAGTPDDQRTPTSLPGAPLGPMIAAYWTDLDPSPACSPAGSVRHGTWGAAPHRVFAVTWTAVAHAGHCAGTGSTFQVRLHESGVVDILLLDADTALDALATAHAPVAIGIAGSPAAGLEFAYGAASETHVRKAVRFQPCPGGHCAVLPNVPPLAAFTAPETAAPGQDVPFLDTSVDPDGAIVAARWDFGDGATATGSQRGHAYATPGLYQVVLTVTDDRGAVARATRVVRVEHAAPPEAQSRVAPDSARGDLEPPVADAGADREVVEGSTVELSGRISRGSLLWRQASGPPVTLEAPGTLAPRFQAPMLGDGPPVDLSFALKAYHEGQQSPWDVVTVRVVSANRPPQAHAGAPAVAYAGDIVRLDASLSTDPEGDALAFTWRQVDGPAATLEGGDGPNPTFTAPSVARETLLRFAVEVRDGRSATSETALVWVRPAPPASAAFTVEPLGGATFRFQALAAGGEAVWDFGDGSPAVTGHEATHTYATPGHYRVTLRHMTAAGDHATSQATVPVAAPASRELSLADLSEPWLFGFLAAGVVVGLVGIGVALRALRRGA